MNIVTLDFETYFDQDYSLSKMTTEEYIRDPRFEVLGMGVRFVNGDKKWFSDPDEFLHHFREEPNSNAFLCHHAQFDGLILSHHFGVRPAAWLDTLSMARLVVGNHLSVSLASLADHFDLKAKNVPYNLFKGKHWHEIDEATQRQVADGCLHDVDLTWQIFNLLARDFPVEEYRVVDMTVRMFTEPKLVGDIHTLGAVWMAEEKRKKDLLAELAVTAADLQSADRFAELLRAEGVEPPTKDGKNGPIYAFAKTDDFMKELADEDSTAGDLARARLGVRSTIDQTRAERLGWMARRGALPVYLRYSGAHTTRWSGGDNLNWQNFRRGGGIRKAVRAPDGYKLITFDLSQVEARLLNALAGQWDVVKQFADGIDIYVIRASEFYGRTITRDDKPERGLGKQIELSCGYGAGDESIRATAKKGSYGPPVILPLAEARRAKELYRSTHPKVVDRWKEGGRMLSRIASGFDQPTEWGPLTVLGKRVYLPNGAWLNYDTLEFSTEWDSWRYMTRKGWKKIYGAALVAETTQALARVIASQAMLRLQAMGYWLAWSTHDDMVIIVESDGKEEYHADVIHREIEKSPAWLPELPLKVEGGVSERYEK